MTGASEFAAFCLGAGMPRTEWQAESMGLEDATTVVVAPRQTGKSETLGLLAAWEALREPDRTVMIVSASQAGADRHLSATRRACDCRIAGLGQRETALMNGSTILCVPPTREDIVGRMVDVLIVDDAAFIEDDILDCAISTTLPRRGKGILASTPFASRGFFHAFTDYSVRNLGVRVVRWNIADAPWIDPRDVDVARKSLSESRFRAEYLAEFAEAVAS